MLLVTGSAEERLLHSPHVAVVVSEVVEVPTASIVLVAGGSTDELLVQSPHPFCVEGDASSSSISLSDMLVTDVTTIVEVVVVPMKVGPAKGET